MLGRLSISQKLVAVVVAPLLLLAALTGFGFTVFQKVKVNGPEYAKIIDTKDLVADILPPPSYLVETQLIVSQMLRSDSPQFEKYVSDVAKLEAQYNERYKFWSVNLNDSQIDKPFLKDSYAAAQQYFTVYNTKFVPQMREAYKAGWQPKENREDVFVVTNNKGEATFETELNALYDQHRLGIDKTVELALAKQVRLEKDTRSQVSGSLGLLGLLALAGAALSGLLGFSVARAVRTPIVALTKAANKASLEDLPRLVQQSQTADIDAPLPSIEEIQIGGNDELGELARAFNSMQVTAVSLASEQARVRRNVSENLVNLARRNQTLLGRSLSLLTDLEQNERDPDKLHELFRVDHLTTRMRRNAESLLVLAGADQAKTWSEPVEVGDVVRAAVSAIEAFDRVDIVGLDSGKVKGAAVSDVAHLLAELIENSTAFSAPDTRVAVIGKQRPDGYLLVVTDDGIGMNAIELDVSNRRITEFAAFDATPTKVLGLNVIGRLAARHGIEVTLAESATAGIAARIVLPASMVDGLIPMDPTFDPMSEFDALSPSPSTVQASWSAATVDTVNDVSVDAISPTVTPEGGVGAVSNDNVRELRPAPAGLVKRIRGAQLPDTGPIAVADEPMSESRPDEVKSSLSNFQSGLRRGEEADLSTSDHAIDELSTAGLWDGSLTDESSLQSAGVTDFLSDHGSVATLAEPVVDTELEAIAEPLVAEKTVVAEKTKGGLTRRVRGAQMPDTGPEADRTLGVDNDPEHVRSTLGSLQRGMASAAAATETGDLADMEVPNE